MSAFRLQFKLLFDQKSTTEFWLWGLGFGLAFSALCFLLLFSFHYRNRCYQGVRVGGIAVGGLTQAEAKELLTQSYQKPKVSSALILVAEDQEQQNHQTSVELSQVVGEPLVDQALEEAFKIGRQGNFLAKTNTILGLLSQETKVQLRRELKNEPIQNALQELAQEVNHPGEEPSLVLQTTGSPDSLQINLGEDGWAVMVDESESKIIELIEDLLFADDGWASSPSRNNLPEQIKLTVVTKTIHQQLSDEEAQNAKQRALAYIGQTAQFIPAVDSSYKEKAFLLNNVKEELNDQQLIELLDLPSGFKQNKIQEMISGWAQEINQPAVNAEFEYNPETLRASVFSPHEPGLELDQLVAEELLLSFMSELETLAQDASDLTNNELKLVIHQTEPEITLKETNEIGIQELLGFGESYYRGSIATRIHNVRVASEKLSMTLIPPGDTFSFNQVVGRVDGSTGFQQAYVIRSGRTLLEFGGGVCQVSTTTFRAMLDAGVNITKRLPHSYRVRYYELNNEPGFDATVYSGEVDLRFVNDTPGHLLIVAEADSSQAYMTVRIYGTTDGRRSTIENYKQWGYSSPPPSQDIPDPSLAPGERRQVENAIPGLKTSFDWIVYDSQGEVIHEKTFFSHYRAWGAKFLVGI